MYAYCLRDPPIDVHADSLDERILGGRRVITTECPVSGRNLVVLSKGCPSLGPKKNLKNLGG